MYRKLRLLGLTIGVLVLTYAAAVMPTATSAPAALVTIVIEGDVTFVMPGGAGERPAQVGDRATLWITYDVSAPPNGGASDVRHYDAAVTAVRFAAGQAIVTASTAKTFKLTDEGSADRDNLDFAANAFSTDSIKASVTSASESEFWTSDALPESFPASPEIFYANMLASNLAGFGGAAIEANVTSVRVEPGGVPAPDVVPLPSGLPLLAGGLGLAALATRRSLRRAVLP